MATDNYLWLKGFARNSGFPLDESSVFDTEEALTAYLLKKHAYRGQIVAVKEAGYTSGENVTPYIVASITQDGAEVLKAYPICTLGHVEKVVEQGIAGITGALSFKGSVSSTSGLPDEHKTGWMYIVAEDGEYAGQDCNAGDIIICKADGTTDNPDDWTVIESNQPKMVIGPEVSVSGNLPVFDGTTGTQIKDSGIAADNILTKSMASDAKPNETRGKGSAGVNDTYARSDHRHPYPSLGYTATGLGTFTINFDDGNNTGLPDPVDGTVVWVKFPETLYDDAAPIPMFALKMSDTDPRPGNIVWNNKNVAYFDSGKILNFDGAYRELVYNGNTGNWDLILDSYVDETKQRIYFQGDRYSEY